MTASVSKRASSLHLTGLSRTSTIYFAEGKNTVTFEEAKAIISAEQVRSVLKQTSLSKKNAFNLIRRDDNSLDLIQLLAKGNLEHVDSSEESPTESEHRHEEEDEGSSCIEDPEWCEENDENEDEENEESSTVQEEEEEDELLEENRHQLILHYFDQLKEYQYLRKKNNFLQDRLYQLLVRKGFINEDQLNESKLKKKKRQRRKKLTHPPTTSISRVTLPLAEEDGNDDEEESSVIPSKSKKSTKSVKISTRSPTLADITEAMHESHLTQKYESSVRRVWQLERVRDEIAFSKNDRLLGLEVKRDETELGCQVYFEEFMNQIRTCSREAINAYSGKHLDSTDTEKFIKEIGKLFNKFRQTINKFYANWHGLSFELKILEETEEETEGEGLRIMEFEQLCGELEILKEKLEYRQDELGKAKSKISQAIQKLAHVKEKDEDMEGELKDKQLSLDILKRRILQLYDIMDAVTERYIKLSEEQKHLERKSVLFDNVKLIRDFEETSQQVTSFQNERRSLKEKERYKVLEVENLRQRIEAIKHNLPELRKRAENEKKSVDCEKGNICTQKCLSETDYCEELRQLRLLELLELRTTEPWKATRDQLIAKTYSPCMSSHKIIKTIQC